MSKRNSRIPLVIIGPSGAGKSTILRQLVLENIIVVEPTWTTRPPRPNEAAESLEHVFVSNEVFQQKQQNGDFLGTIQMFGLPYWYGLPALRQQTDSITTVLLRAPLVKQFAHYYPKHVIYQIYDDKHVVAERLKQRETTGEQSGSRYGDYDKEVQLGNTIAARSFKNTNLTKTITEIQQAIQEDF
ncbi:MAG TPA: hypothetical protein VK674_03545 [Candidatus Limnocylindria bacterium]|nr:hypothetical protein [Candidatus Limnocylindria bacterium]